MVWVITWIEDGLTREKSFDNEVDALRFYDELESRGVFWLDLDEIGLDW